MAAMEFQLVVRTKYTFLQVDAVCVRPWRRRSSTSLPPQGLLPNGERRLQEKDSYFRSAQACSFDEEDLTWAELQTADGVPCSRPPSGARSESSVAQDFDSETKSNCPTRSSTSSVYTKRSEMSPRWADVSDEHGNNETLCAGERSDAPAGKILVLKNIPSRASASSLIATIKSSDYSGHFEYVYMPLKPKSGQSRGFALASFASAEEADHFRRMLRGKAIAGLESQKALEVELATSREGMPVSVQRKLENAMKTQWGPVLVAASGSFR